MPVQVGRSHCAAVTRLQAMEPTDTNSAGSITAHPCKKRKDGAPSVRTPADGAPTAHTTSLKVGHTFTCSTIGPCHTSAILSAARFGLSPFGWQTEPLVFL
jgi:hypothetical protein